MVSLSMAAERNEDGRRSGDCGQLVRRIGSGRVSELWVNQPSDRRGRGSNPKPVCAAHGYDINFPSVAVSDESSLSRCAKLRSGSTRDALRAGGSLHDTIGFLAGSAACRMEGYLCHPAHVDPNRWESPPGP